MTYISLTLVGLMWVLPFLHYRHQYPLTTFDQEWWSALLGVLALTLLAARDFWQQPEIPRIAQLPAALIAIVLLQLALHKVAYFDQGLLYILYLLFAALLMLLGARLRTCFGIEKLAIVLAGFLLVGAELSALLGVLQHYRWHTPLDSVVVLKISSSVYGNLAQPNHFANYVALGLISLGLLFQQHKLKAGYVVLLAVPLLFVMTLSGSRSSWLYLLMMSGLAWWWTRRDAGLRPLLRYNLSLIAGFCLMHLIVQLPFLAGADSSIDTMQRLFGDAASGSIRLYLWRESWLIFAQSPWLGVGFGQFAWHHFQLLPVLRPSNISGLYNNAHNFIFQFAAEAGTAGVLVLFAALGVWLYGLRRATLSAAHWWGYAALGVLAIHSLLEYPLWYTYFVAVAAILLGALDETHYRLELRNVGRMSVVMILLLGLLSLLQLRSGYQQLKDTLAIRPVSGNVAEAYQRTRDGLIAVHGGSLLSPYAELFMSSYTEVNTDHLKEKLALNANVMRFVPIAQVAYRQAFFLAQDGQFEQARQVLEQAIWSYPGNGDAHRQLVWLAEKDPEHFSALLEFALQKEQEHTRAVRYQ
ncbi:MAG TPA: Wzy polymerase domain-containing protein [Gallionella sp.]|nr:Wzy polymerase domain-containing protein [Gallionella sp.]